MSESSGLLQSLTLVFNGLAQRHFLSDLHKKTEVLHRSGSGALRNPSCSGYCSQKHKEPLQEEALL